MSTAAHPPACVLLARGTVADPDALRRSWDEWHDRVASDENAWLGSTGGISSAGQWLAAIRYSSEEAGRMATADADATPSFLSGATTLEVTGDVHLVEGNGSPDGGGLVQFMRAHVADRQRLGEVEGAVGNRFAAVRPDFLAGLRAWTGPGRLTVVDWFTSEADARAGEAGGVPTDLGALFGEWMSLLSDVEWYDVADPWQVAH